MSARLRETSSEYANEIAALERDIQQTSTMLEGKRARLAETEAAKKIVDEQIEKLPKSEPTPESASAPPETRVVPRKPVTARV